jgi:hypothetical protein
MENEYSDWDEEHAFYGDERILADGYAPESEEALQAPKAPRYEGLRYMCRYVAEKPQIAKIKVQSAYDVYLRRGFVEISKEEFDSLVKVVKGTV